MQEEKKGYFIVLEGPDGAGKTTQLRLLADRLQLAGYQLVITREPGGTRLGEELREIILRPRQEGIVPEAELFLYLACRAQLVKEVIVPALAEGKIVLCDRFSDSTFAYQGGGRGFPREILAFLNRVAVGDLEPDCVVILDLPPEEGLKRGKKCQKLDRLETEKIEFHRRVREEYLRRAASGDRRYALIDARGSIEEVHQRVWKAVSYRLPIRAEEE